MTKYKVIVAELDWEKPEVEADTMKEAKEKALKILEERSDENHKYVIVEMLEIKKDWNIDCDFGTDLQEFEHCVGRPPRDKKEMEEWVHLLKNGIDAQLDWSIINRCASEEIKERGLRSDEI